MIKTTKFIGNLILDSNEVVIGDEVEFLISRDNGSYPVYVQTNEQGKVVMAVIDFDSILLEDETEFILEVGE